LKKERDFILTWDVEKFDHLRVEKGIRTRQAAGKLCGVTNLNRMCRKPEKITVEALNRIGRGMGIDPRTLLIWEAK
jgi:hypothetical protein